MRRGSGKPQRALRVLIADDAAPIRLMCRVNLQLEGFEVVEACDGREAVELALEHPPDVAILDIEMPGLDGWQVADQLRVNPDCDGAAIVFLTANTEGPVRAKAVERDGLLVGKPFNPVGLPDLVRMIAPRRPR
jgi:CheY-like chemotaxis protein